MTRVLMFGYCPLPNEGLRVSAPGLRTWHFLQVLLKAGHDVCLIGDRIYGAYPDDLPDLITRQEGRLTYHSVTDARWHNPGAMHALIAPFKADCAISVTTTASAIAAGLVGTLPLWADLYGSIMAEAQMKALVYSDDSYLPHFWHLENHAIERADIFSTVSERQKWTLIGELGMWGRLNQWTSGYDFAGCIPIASEVTPYTPARKVIRGVLTDDSAFVILYSGGYNTWTDVDTLFAALEQIMSGHPEVQFVSTGGKIDGHDDLTYGRFQNMIESSPYRERYHLCGWVPNEDVPAYYLESNVGVNVDRQSYEAQLGSRTRVLDWMRAGLPSVSSSLTELSEQVVAAGAGLAYEPGSVDALIRCLEQCVERPVETRAMGQRAHQLLLDKFTFEATTAQLQAWAAAPSHAPDYGQDVPKLVRPAQDISSGLARAVKQRSLGLDLALRVWPMVARTTDALGLMHLQRFMARVGLRALRLNRTQYQVNYLEHHVPSTMRVNEMLTCPITVRNEGKTPWISAHRSKMAVNVSYHWRTETNTMIIREGRRTPLPDSVPGGQSTEVQLVIAPPAQPGCYRLEIDLVREGVTWFSDVGASVLSMLVDVQPVAEN